MKFSKFALTFAIALVFAFSGVLLGACDATVKSIAIDSGMPEYVRVDGTLDTANVKAVLTYSDNTTKKVTAEELEFSTLDTSTSGEKEITVTHKSSGVKIKVKIQVIPAEELVGITVVPNRVYYSGDAQNLIDTINGTENNDEILYKVGDGEYSSAMPKGTDVGTYNVTVKVTRAGFIPKEYAVEASIKRADVSSMTSELKTAFDSIVNDSTRNVITENHYANVDDNVLIAGDDNDFKLQINAKVIIDKRSVVVSNIPTRITLKQWNASTSGYESVNVNNSTNAVAIVNNVENTINFNESAIGNKFQITVAPISVAQGYTVNSIVMYVNVVDGYNVYTAKDLCVINNTDDNGWDEWKTANGYANYISTSATNIKAIVLQNDINVTDSDIPSNYFYSATEANRLINNNQVDVACGTTGQDGYKSAKDFITGSMKDQDGLEVYARYLGTDGIFNIYGNYFAIDYSKLSKCVVECGESNGIKIADLTNQSAGNAITTHTAFFAMRGNNSTMPNSGQDNPSNYTINTTIKNTAFVGNGARTDSALDSGGIMIAKIQGANSIVKNCKYTDAFIGFLYGDNSFKYSPTSLATADHVTSGINIQEDTKGYNCYNSMFYVQAVPNLIIKGGEYKRAGGPVIIADSRMDVTINGEAHQNLSTNIKVIGSTMESFVTGAEPWFVTYGATALVAQITALNAAYVQAAANTTYLQTKDNVQGLMNLKVVFKSTDSAGITAVPVSGKCEFYDSASDYANNIGTPLDMSTYSYEACNSGQNILQNSQNGDVYGSTTYLAINGYIAKLGNVDAMLKTKEELDNLSLNSQQIEWIANYMLERKNSSLTPSELIVEAAGALTNYMTDLALSLQSYIAGIADYTNNDYEHGDLTAIHLFNTFDWTITDEETSQGSGDYIIKYGNTNVATITKSGNNWTTLNLTLGQVQLQLSIINNKYIVYGTSIEDYQLLGVIDGNSINIKNASVSQTGPVVDTTNYTVQNGYIINNNSEAVSPLSNLSGYTAFALSNIDGDFASITNGKTTNVNFYIFNGMAIVVELYKIGTNVVYS